MLLKFIYFRASDESGVEISSLEQLLIFLCKLTHYELIDEVPVVVNENFDFDGEIVRTSCSLYYFN